MDKLKRFADPGKTMDKLKPCPFCGGEADCNNNSLMQGGKFKWSVECWGCGVITSAFNTEEEAIEAWNRRASDVC